ncbi:hypothetical protein OIU74_015676 [Salix koriyanagi]|uniref:Uncharacterized protein n=1 Tax=Salix koriyanagi TaxID=2511006 RepID=A0A9Q0SVI1_9ROSI|nr:hypothetical protein OIU74_015676 [Salix koriyanagi]
MAVKQVRAISSSSFRPIRKILQANCTDQLFIHGTQNMLLNLYFLQAWNRWLASWQYRVFRVFNNIPRDRLILVNMNSGHDIERRRQRVWFQDADKYVVNFTVEFYELGRRWRNAEKLSGLEIN